MHVRQVRSLFLAVPLACGVVVAACSSNPPPEPVGATNVQPLNAEMAAPRIAQARCAHALSCNEVGGSRSYASMDACVSKNRGDAENALCSSDCPRGVDPTRLDSCISAMNAEACSGIGSGFSRSLACKTGALCP